MKKINIKLVLLVLVALTSLVLFISGIVAREAQKRSGINTIKNIFEENYAFDKTKNSGHGIFYISGSPSNDEQIYSYLSEINTLKVDIKNIERNYQSLDVSNFKIIKVDCVEKIQPTMELKDLSQELLIKKANNMLNFASKEVVHDFIFDDKTRQSNDFNGYLTREFSQLHSNAVILNKGAELNGNISTNEIVERNTLNYNAIEKVTELEKIPVKKINYKELVESIDSKKLRLYKIGYIGDEISTSLSQLGAASDETITINSIEIEYLFMSENSLLLPVLRLNGKIPTNAKTQNDIFERENEDISFWIWFIK